MKKILVLLALIAAVHTSMAQFSVGAKTGISFNDIEMNGFSSGIQQVTDPLITPSFGIFGAYDVSSHLSVRTGLNYLRRGLVFQEQTSVNIFNLPIPVGLHTELHIDYIDIPLTAIYRHPFGPIEIYALGGVGLSRAIDAKIQPKVTALLDFNLPVLNIATDDFNSTNIYGEGGIGVAYGLPKGKLFVESTYQHGFESLKPDFLVDLDLKNKGFSVGIGYVMSF